MTVKLLAALMLGIGVVAHAQRTAAPAVKQFAEVLVKSHTAADDELKKIAKDEGIALPKSLVKDDANVRTEPEKLSGAQFD